MAYPYGDGVWIPCIQQYVRYIDCSNLLKTVPLPTQLYEHVLRAKLRRCHNAFERAVENARMKEHDFAFSKRVVQTWGVELGETQKMIKTLNRKYRKKRIGFANSKVKVLVNDRVK